MIGTNHFDVICSFNHFINNGRGFGGSSLIWKKQKSEHCITQLSYALNTE